MKKTIEQQAEEFASIIEKAGVEYTPENVVKCFGFAKQAMREGVCSVEAYYRAKEILLFKLECANEWVN